MDRVRGEVLAVDDRLELAEGAGGPAQEGGARGGRPLPHGERQRAGGAVTGDDDAEAARMGERDRPRIAPMPARMGGDRPGAGSRSGPRAARRGRRRRSPSGRSPWPSARAGRLGAPTARRRAPSPRAANTTVPRGGAGTGATSRTIDAGVELTSRPGRRDVSTATATTTSTSRTSSTRTLRRRRAGSPSAERLIQPSTMSTRKSTVLAHDRPSVAGRPELRDSGQLDEGAGEARAGDQHHGGQREEGEPPDRLLVLPASQQQHELEDAAGPEGGGDDVDEVRRDRDRPSVPGPIRVTGEGRGEEQGQREDEGRCDQLRPGAREGGEQDAGERRDHGDLRDPLEARRRAICGMDEPGAAERDGEQGDRHRRRRPAHRRPRDEQEEEGRPARDQDAAEEEPAGEHVEGSRVASRRARARNAGHRLRQPPRRRGRRGRPTRGDRRPRTRAS